MSEGFAITVDADALNLEQFTPRFLLFPIYSSLTKLFRELTALAYSMMSVLTRTIKTQVRERKELEKNDCGDLIRNSKKREINQKNNFPVNFHNHVIKRYQWQK